MATLRREACQAFLIEVVIVDAGIPIVVTNINLHANGIARCNRIASNLVLALVVDRFASGCNLMGCKAHGIPTSTIAALRREACQAFLLEVAIVDAGITLFVINFNLHANGISLWAICIFSGAAFGKCIWKHLPHWKTTYVGHITDGTASHTWADFQGRVPIP